MLEEFPDYHVGAIKVTASGARIRERYRQGCGSHEHLLAAARAESARATLGGRSGRMAATQLPRPPRPGPWESVDCAR